MAFFCRMEEALDVVEEEVSDFNSNTELHVNTMRNSKAKSQLHSWVISLIRSRIAIHFLSFHHSSNDDGTYLTVVPVAGSLNNCGAGLFAEASIILAIIRSDGIDTSESTTEPSDVF